MVIPSLLAALKTYILARANTLLYCAVCGLGTPFAIEQQTHLETVTNGALAFITIVAFLAHAYVALYYNVFVCAREQERK